MQLSNIIPTLDEWPFGPAQETARERIGQSTGFASQIDRVQVLAADGRAHSVVIKTTPDEGWRQEMFNLRSLSEDFSDAVPACFGGTAARDGGGIVALSDLGDSVHRDLNGDTLAISANSVIRFLARLHAGLWDGDPPDRLPTSWEQPRWSDRLAVATRTHPNRQADVSYLVALLPQMNGAARRIALQPRVRIHGDLHFDNILWRPDGSLVVIDWPGAWNGPACIDLATLIFPWPDCDLDGIVSDYLTALTATGGEPPEVATLTESLWDMMLVTARGTIAFAGRDDANNTEPRYVKVREAGLGQALEWIARMEDAGRLG